MVNLLFLAQSGRRALLLFFVCAHANTILQYFKNLLVPIIIVVLHSIDFVDIMVGGYAFRLRIFLEKELMLVKAAVKVWYHPQKHFLC